MMAEQHPAVRRHKVGAVLEKLGRRRVVVARTDDLHLDQPRIEPVSDDVRTDRRDDNPYRVDRLAPGERDDRPGDGAEHRDDAEHDLVPRGDRGAVDDGDGWQVFVGMDVADVVAVLSDCHGGNPTRAKPTAPVRKAWFSTARARRRWCRL